MHGGRSSAGPQAAHAGGCWQGRRAGAGVGEWEKGRELLPVSTPQPYARDWGVGQDVMPCTPIMRLKYKVYVRPFGSVTSFTVIARPSVFLMSTRRL